jgi:hypothetical protein
VPFTQVGEPGAGNTISGNTQAGVYILGRDATSNLIQGNIIGLGPNGKSFTKGPATDSTNPFPTGVFIEDSSSNIIGGTRTGAGNTISGNNVGVYIFGTAGSSANNQILGNSIGLGINGASSPGNALYGVILINAPNNNVPQSGAGLNQIVASGIANYREYSGSVATKQQSSSRSGSGAGSKSVKKPQKHTSHGAPRSPAGTVHHTPATGSGHKVPAGPAGKSRVRVRF